MFSQCSYNDVCFTGFIFDAIVSDLSAYRILLQFLNFLTAISVVDGTPFICTVWLVVKLLRECLLFFFSPKEVARRYTTCR